MLWPTCALPHLLSVALADKWFLYPEQDPNSDYYMPVIGQRPNFGIAVSGGGFRAVTCALGYVRCVHCVSVRASSKYSIDWMWR